MFGFLGRPCQACASNDTHSVYRSFFCGLSGALRDDYSPAARFLVNRDSTFLSLSTASLGPAPPDRIMRTCCQPVAVPRPLFSTGLHARYAAAVTICGLAAKLDDDRLDEKGLRGLAARFFGKALAPMTDKAISFLNSVSFPTADVIESLKEQEALEARQPDFLEAAEPTAQTYGMIFGHGALIAGSPEKKADLSSLGHSLGRLIYWKDAHDDQAEDARKGRFNPLTGTAPEELRHHFGREFVKLREAPALQGHFHQTMEQVVTATQARHQVLIPTAMASSQENKAPAQSRRGKKEKKKRSWSDCCDCFCPCHEGSPCDSLVDCGPGDSGCCDCDCCPCS